MSCVQHEGGNYLIHLQRNIHWYQSDAGCWPIFLCFLFILHTASGTLDCVSLQIITWKNMVGYVRSLTFQEVGHHCNSQTRRWMSCIGCTDEDGGQRDTGLPVLEILYSWTQGQKYSKYHVVFSCPQNTFLLLELSGLCDNEHRFGLDILFYSHFKIWYLLCEVRYCCNIEVIYVVIIFCIVLYYFCQVSIIIRKV